MDLKRVVIMLLSLTVSLLASMDYAQGIKYYEAGEYKKAFPIILEVSKKGVNKAAQYRVAEMYEKGLGTKVDYKESTFWYKAAACRYASTWPPIRINTWPVNF